MTIRDFTNDHSSDAMKLVRMQYEHERIQTPALPVPRQLPSLDSFVKNGLGVSAYENDKMVGFLCCWGPFDNAFRTTSVKGVFSPMHGNAAISPNRASVYARMYQKAAEKWVRAGAVSHAICIYAHDLEVKEQFFEYGFGLRCKDAIRTMDCITYHSCPDTTNKELERQDLLKIFTLHSGLVEHLAHSPSFMYHAPETIDQFEAKTMSQTARYFAACQKGRIVAYLKIADDGENFACSDPDMLNICGAFCLPECRGSGIFQSLLNFVVQQLRSEGYCRLGVDFESINPTANGFWSKYFTAYTYGLVRRVDENILTVYP